MLQSQQRSTESTLRGLEQVLKENAELRAQMQRMEQEMARLQNVN